MTLWLSRLTLSRSPSVEALKALIDPAERGRATDAHHRLIWSAFAGDPDRRRDFLWRAEGEGVFHVLSARPPEASPFFEPPEIKAFAPSLAVNDRLEFVLRANATRTRKVERGGREKKAHDDVVMNALRDVPRGEKRREVRMAVAAEAGGSWLRAQGGRSGFSVAEVSVIDYAVQALPDYRGPRGGQPQFGVLEFTGVIVVEDSEVLLAKLALGFGRAKAFGCGMMMIRRAR
jgi:CRISPR system Cascade subunit CasE